MADVFSRSVEVKQPWDRFAETDPYTYILTDLKDGSLNDFWQSGQQIVDCEILSLVKSRRISTGVAMELGCGVGRLALPLASFFQEVWGVDIAQAMVRRARRFAENRHINNAHFMAVSGPDDLCCQMGKFQGRVDFIYSLLVFQHIADFSLIEGYIRAIGSLLGAAGTAYLQFDTRPRTLPYHVKSRLPDFILPRFWRKGIRRIRRSPSELERCIQKADLQIVAELTPATDYHRYILRRADKGSI